MIEKGAHQQAIIVHLNENIENITKIW